MLYLAFFVLGDRFYVRKELSQLRFTELYSFLNIARTEGQLAFPSSLKYAFSLSSLRLFYAAFNCLKVF